MFRQCVRYNEKFHYGKPPEMSMRIYDKKYYDDDEYTFHVVFLFFIHY